MRVALPETVHTQHDMVRAATQTVFDVAIIGAGINGAGIARDAAMRGLKVLLIDKSDVGRGTTSASTRLIHGGLRYLEHFDFGLVRESLRERETLLKIAPHLVKPLPMTIPTATSRIASRNSIVTTVRRLAPSATRMPIS